LPAVVNCFRDIPAIAAAAFRNCRSARKSREFLEYMDARKFYPDLLDMP
jgi:hypothetical protein